MVRLQEKHSSFFARRLQPSVLTGVLPTLFLAQDDAPPTKFPKDDWLTCVVNNVPWGSVCVCVSERTGSIV